MSSKARKRARRHHPPATWRTRNFCRTHNTNNTPEPKVKEMPAAIAAPATPIAGTTAKPKIKTYKRGKFSRLTPALIHNGDHASPDALSAALKTNMAANAKLKIDSQRIFWAANSNVTGSNPNTDATGEARKNPKNAIANENIELRH